MKNQYTFCTWSLRPVYESAMLLVGGWGGRCRHHWIKRSQLWPCGMVWVHFPTTETHESARTYSKLYSVSPSDICVCVPQFTWHFLTEPREKSKPETTKRLYVCYIHWFFQPRAAFGVRTPLLQTHSTHTATLWFWSCVCPPDGCSSIFILLMI